MQTMEQASARGTRPNRQFLLDYAYCRARIELEAATAQLESRSDEATLQRAERAKERYEGIVSVRDKEQIAETRVTSGESRVLEVRGLTLGSFMPSHPAASKSPDAAQTTPIEQPLTEGSPGLGVMSQGNSVGGVAYGSPGVAGVPMSQPIEWTGRPGGKR